MLILFVIVSKIYQFLQLPHLDAYKANFNDYVLLHTLPPYVLLHTASPYVLFHTPPPMF